MVVYFAGWRRQIAVVGIALAIALTISVAHAATLTTLASFNGVNGNSPVGDLIADAVGNLYGTTSRGGENGHGTVFSLDPNSGAITTLASFNVANGSYPVAGLVADADGTFYGTTRAGGASGSGTVFQFDISSGVITTLVSFSGKNGAAPESRLTKDTYGNLYGTTSSGGTSNPGLEGQGPIGYGTVFQINKNTNTLKTLAVFLSTSDEYRSGGGPKAGLTIDAAGNFYGTTSKGGTNGKGTVFKFDPKTGIVTTIASFDGENGTRPISALIVDSTGDIFGTAEGLYDSLGTVFKLDPDTGVLTTLASFDGVNGSRPNAGLITDAVGNLFGTTPGGGSSNRGTIFKIDRASGLLTTLASFNGVDGGSPSAGLTADSQGNLYGTTWIGGLGYGTVYKLSDAGFVVVPEPTSLTLLLLSGAAVASTRRRCQG